MDTIHPRLSKSATVRVWAQKTQLWARNNPVPSVFQRALPFVPGLLFSLIHTRKKVAFIGCVSHVAHPCHLHATVQKTSADNHRDKTPSNPGRSQHCPGEGEGGRGEGEGSYTNTTVQTISISSLEVGRKWLVVSNLAQERAEKLTPDNILLMPLLPASPNRVWIPH